MTALAPASIRSCARPTERMPPPTRQGSRAATLPHERVVVPMLIAASRSISWILGNFAKRLIQPSRSSDAIASFSPWIELNDLAAFEIDRRNQHV